MNRLAVIQELRKRTDRVLVGFSGGKDSIATLILCLEHFPKVEAFHLYMVKGLSFRESVLAYTRKRFGVVIHEAPSAALASTRRRGSLSHEHSANRPPALSHQEVSNAIRLRTGIEWIAVGEKEHDSMERRGQLRKNPNGLFEKRRECWPIAYWSHHNVWNLLKRNRIPAPQEYAVFGTGFRLYKREHILKLAKHFPEDYKKVCQAFPMVKGYVMREKFADGR